MRSGSGNACLSLVLLTLSAAGVRSAFAEDKVLTGLVVDARGDGHERIEFLLRGVRRV